ncbi:MAG: thiamine pyrophosphate-dependent enzyme [Gammaproteobacteria bacterium]|nr:thiamine pyrophosphate-dependent enzyme [Gammaproteobacteria bacterium]
MQRAGSYGTKEIVIGMAHRGRLNVLINIFGKSPRSCSTNSRARCPRATGSGDVKYHQGFSSNVQTPGGEVHVALAFNPSHLEIVSPVVGGFGTCAPGPALDYRNARVLPLLIHGDAAFAGQGVVMETFQMSQTRGLPAPAAPCIWSSTTRWASPPAARTMPAPPSTAPMWRRWSRRRFST